MEFKKITSKDNSFIKLINSLQTSAKARKEHQMFVLEGIRICSDAMENSIRFDKLIISQTANEKYEKAVLEFQKNADEVYILPDSLFKYISDTDSPQGIMAVAKLKKNSIEINTFGRYIALENLNDPSNLGAVARTAEALGVDGIILTSGGCDPYSPKSLRASMGTLLRLPVIVTDNLELLLKNSSLKSYACVVERDATPIDKVEFSNGSVLLIGNEANGLTDNIKTCATQKITIRMLGKAESLNAAAAASIAMWEMMRNK